MIQYYSNNTVPFLYHLRYIQIIYMISSNLQYTFQSRWSPLQWSHNYFQVCEQTMVTGGTNLENRMDAEAIRNAIHDVFLIHPWLFFSRFLLSNTSITRCETRILGFIIFKIVDQYHAHPKIRKPWHFLCFWLLSTVFTFCCPLSWLPIWLWSIVLDPWLIRYHILHQKNCLLRWNSSKQRYELYTCCVVFDRLWVNMIYTSNTALSWTNVCAKWWIRYLLISLRCQLSHPSSIYDRPKPDHGFVYVF